MIPVTTTPEMPKRPQIPVTSRSTGALTIENAEGTNARLRFPRGDPRLLPHAAANTDGAMARGESLSTQGGGTTRAMGDAEDRVGAARAVPRVSLGLPIYNSERYLEGLFECLLAQDFEDFEIIVSDNASTDGSQEICRRYAARDDRIRYYRNPTNLGLAPNFNRCFELARGELFKWTPFDDEYAPSYLRSCVETLEAAPASVVLCYPKTTLIDENGGRLREHPDDLDLREPEPHQRLRHFLLRYNLCNPIVGVMRTSALRKTQLHGAYLSSDITLLAELALLGEWWEIPQPLFFRRIYSGSSRQGDRRLSDVAKWFNPSHSGTLLVSPRTRVFFHILGAIWQSPMRAAERARCLASASWTWWARRFRVRAGLLRRRLRDHGRRESA